MASKLNRRTFLGATAASAFAPYFFSSSAHASDESPKIAGFDLTQTDYDPLQEWRPYTDRKLRVGLVGYGVCKFAADFYFQDHPNVEVVAVSDLFPDRCDELAKRTRCEKQYPSLEEMVKDDSIEAIFVATDAPSHARHCVLCLEHGKHVCHAVPVHYGQPEEGEKLLECVKKNRGLKYAMFETSSYHDDVYAMEKIYAAGGFGKLIYTEGEYNHTSEPGAPSIGSYGNWRGNGAPLWYPTHASAYYVTVTHKRFISVSCQGINPISDPNPKPNRVGNTYDMEVALLHTEEGGLARMMYSSSYGTYLENGRVRGEIGGFDSTYRPLEQGYTGTAKGQEIVASLGNSLRKPALPPGVEPGGHGGSHGYLCCDFVDAVLKDQETRVGIIDALNMTTFGYYAHLSATKDGELLKVPEYTL
ncbi:MAG: Gfo/Idh/MocA family oxidoreductase [Thermoguttaceae bacterium]|jgi:predicted dehydrogenase|nr:Gfo/Idh/MocA family oxidoreductase [Thermoguttaceae bacterium]